MESFDVDAETTFLRLHNVLRPWRAEEELAREVRSHLAQLEDDFQRRGMTPDDARLAARRTFGGVEQTKDLHRTPGRSYGSTMRGEICDMRGGCFDAIRFLP